MSDVPQSVTDLAGRTRRETVRRYPLPLPDRNRRVLLKAFDAPPHAADVCEQIEDRYLGIRIMWFQESRIKGFERPAGFYAWRAGEMPLVKNGRGGYRERHEWYGQTAAELVAQLP